MNHCWKDYREWLVEQGREYSDEHIATYHDGNKTCLAADGHDGDHEWIPDDDIVIKLA